MSLILSFKSVVDVIKLFWRKSRFPKNTEIQKKFIFCLNLHKNVKTMYAIYKQSYTQ